MKSISLEKFKDIKFSFEQAFELESYEELLKLMEEDELVISIAKNWPMSSLTSKDGKTIYFVLQTHINKISHRLEKMCFLGLRKA